MVYADVLVIFGGMLMVAFIGFGWGRWERMSADIAEEIMK